MIAGSLFTTDYLKRGVRETTAFAELQPGIAALKLQVRALLEAVRNKDGLVEGQTEERIVKPLLDLLGWGGCWSVQERLGREDVPDYLLYPDPETFARADGEAPGVRYRNAVALADAKAWRVDLDKRGSGVGPDEAPSGQILRYLRRADTLSNGRVLWGVLTNGRVWRLYFQAAQDRLRDYFEVDLQAALNPPAQTALDLGDRWTDGEQAFALWVHFFRRTAFGVQAEGGRSLHREALDEGRRWQARLQASLSGVVFGSVYPGLIRALVEGDPERPPVLTPDYLAGVREAALTLLYRLLFSLYAEDRDLLPRRNRDYREYSLSQMREYIASRVGKQDVFSAHADNLWQQVRNLFEMIDQGDESLGMPAYNGGLFDPDSPRSVLLNRVRLPDAVFAPLLDALSREPPTPGQADEQRKRINYRDLSVRQLGSIYERLLEREPVADAAAPSGVELRLNPFARKGSGSYYTPDELVQLIIGRTLGPLVQERLDAFESALATVAGERDGERISAELDRADPASAMLRLRVCDPAMGSGHFLVGLLDWLAPEAFGAMGWAEKKAAAAGFPDWRSPLAVRLQDVRVQIRTEADAHRWAIRDEQLSDENLIRRLVLKRCVYGVDKNPMAVELAKVSLWLHTFTAGAPLSFLDHHLRCGDSLFGEWVQEVSAEVQRGGSALFLGRAIQAAIGSEQLMRGVERRSDALLSEAEESARDYDDVRQATAPLNGFLDLWHALRWLKPGPDEKRALRALYDGAFGDPVRVAAGLEPLRVPPELVGQDGQVDLIAAEGAAEQMSLLPGQASARDYVLLRRLLERARALAAEQRFLHWQVAFPGVWSRWQDARQGGFDAVIGNPPWDRMKMQEVEWFAERRPAIARQARAADRKAAIAALRATTPFPLEGGRAGDGGGEGSRFATAPDNTLGNPVPAALIAQPFPPPSPTLPPSRGKGASADADLVADYDLARSRTEAAMGVARSSGQFPLLSRGDINLYSLFVERAQTLIRPDGVAGLLTPSGIASDLTAAPFFKSLSTAGRVIALFDFENRRGGGRGAFFPDVDSRFKFCAFIAGGTGRAVEATEAAFFLQDPPQKDDPRLFRLTAADFARVNPNTGTAPIFRSARDAEITRGIYDRLPVLVDRSSGEEIKAWPVRYSTMFHMTNDSALFWTRARLDKAQAYEVGGGRWRKGDQEWVPLYEGKIVQAYDHRAAHVVMNALNVHRPAQQEETTAAEKVDPTFISEAQYWIDVSSLDLFADFRGVDWTVGYKDVPASTNERTMISAVVPRAGYGNTLPVIWATKSKPEAVVWTANFNSLAFDYVARSKVQGQHLNWFIVEQLPVVPPAAYDRRFGAQTAGEIVRDHVLRLSYTAHDLAPFARDLGYVDPDGKVLAPIVWNEDERRQLRARLDALYFHLYGVTDEADVRHVLSTFPIVERKDRAAWEGVYLTAEMVIWHMRVLTAEGAGRDAPIPDLIAAAKRRAAG